MTQQVIPTARTSALLNWYAALHSLYFIVPGILLEIIAITALSNQDIARNLVSELGGLLLISGLLSLFWEIRAKRALIEETLILAGVAENLAISGVTHVGLDYKETKVWSGLAQAQKLLVVASHPNMWRKSHLSALEMLSARNGAIIRLVFPDPSNAETMRMLAFRDNETVLEAEASIRKCIDEFNIIFKDSQADYLIQLSSSLPTYTAYQIDNDVIFTIYPQALGRPSDIPTFRLSSGAMKEWLMNDIQAAIDPALNKST